ncbi:MAG: endonuclease domain-containing protein [Verrucomicrobia bacterium]|nr:endonuclease domain-containing protein [Verrucomicrobiota bacterium]MCX6908434.1 endonuclease domain-containing protein [Verrucomicrobiota bacterium]
MPSQIARLLRKRPTPAEKLLWRWLRGRRFSRFKFRRQHPIGHYVLDFYCCEARLNIELDGGGHNDLAQELRDKERDEFLKAQGILVLRFLNLSLLKNSDGVRMMIWEALHERTSGQQQDSR